MHTANFFYDKEHAVNYLVGSLIRVDGRPAYVQSVQYKLRGAISKIVLTYEFMPERGMSNTVQLDSDRIDMSPIPLGLLNYKLPDKIFLAVVQRVPKRVWKVGLSERTCQILTPLGPGRLRWHDFLSNSSLTDLVNGIYPSYQQALELIKDNRAVAFSRQFFVCHKKNVYNARRPGHVVGKAMPNGIKLDQKYHYLIQVIEKAGVQCVF